MLRTSPVHLQERFLQAVCADLVCGNTRITRSCCGIEFVTMCKWRIVYVYIGQTNRILQQRYTEHIRYIEHNYPQSAYALHILNNRHEYGTQTDTMKLLRHISNPTMLLPSEKLFIRSYHHHKHFIPKEHKNEVNPLYRTILDVYDMSLTHSNKINTTPRQSNTRITTYQIRTYSLYKTLLMMDRWGPKHVELTYVMNKIQSLENFVYLVRLHI